MCSDRGAQQEEEEQEEGGGGCAEWHAESAVDAVVRVDEELRVVVFAVDAVHGTDFDTGHVHFVPAQARNHPRHRSSPYLSLVSL